jgi:hypothetical protein
MKKGLNVTSSLLDSVHTIFHDHLLDALGRITLKKVDKDPKGGSGKRSEVAKPKIKENGPRARNLMCPMCMGHIKVGLQYARCKCGQPFHVVCLTRMGCCPICGEAWDEKKVKAVTFVNGNKGASPSAQRLECPSCNKMVGIYCNECDCGAIFIRDNDSFLCPECGGRVDLNKLTCLTCGEAFRDCDIVTCPACGRRFDALAGPCECGTFLGDDCPECGGHLGLGDNHCPQCGVQINFVE